RCAPGASGSSSARVTSAPTIAASPRSRAARPKRTLPYSPLWSVTATARSPSSSARAANSSGCEAPSRKEKLVWQCSSAWPLVTHFHHVPAAVVVVAGQHQQDARAGQDAVVLARRLVAPPGAAAAP